MTTPRVKGRSTVWLYSAETGGCGACAQSIAALQAPRYAGSLRAQGISFARSPRHADIVLLSGALTAASRPSVQALLDGIPQPHALVAVGDCALNGCVFSGSAALAESAAEALDVNIEIGGCPPSPETILVAIAEAAQVLANDNESDSTQSDTENSVDDDGDDDNHDPDQEERSL